MTGAQEQGDSRNPGVLVVSHSYGYGEDLTYYGAIFAALRRHEPDLAIAVDRATRFDNPEELDLRGLYRRYSLPMPGGRTGYDRALHLADPMLAMRVARLRPDVLLTIEFTPVALLAVLGSLAAPRTKRVLLVEGNPAARGGSTAPAVTALKCRAVAAAHTILTNNDGGARYLVDRLGADPRRLIVAPYLASRPAGAEVAITPDPETPLRLLFANSLTERKNPAVMLAALSLLPEAIRMQCRLALVGDGPLRQALEREAAARGLGALVSFHGHCPYADLGRHLAAADVLINPTRRDYRSLSSFEGLGYGLALLVSSADGAAAETVIEGATGHVFAPHDAVALAAHIARLASDRARQA